MKTSTKTIWKTVVFSAALLGGTATVGCSKNKKSATDPCADPCKGKKMAPDGGDGYGGDEYGEGAWGEYDEEGRPRGGDDGGGDVGRGFVLN
jgi:hypothetical protein